jgi:VWFA-related protein
MLTQRIRIWRLLATAILGYGLSAGAQAPAGSAGFQFKPDQSVYVLAVKTSTSIISERAFGERYIRNVIHLDCGSNPQPLSNHNSPHSFPPQDHRLTLEGSDVAGNPMISTDPLLKSSIEDAFRKEKKFKIADTADNADFVFFAFSLYPGGVKLYQSGTVTIWDLYQDSAYFTNLVNVLAFAASAPVFRQVRKDVLALDDAAAWHAYVWSNSLPQRGCRQSAQESAALYLVKKFQEEVLQNRKPARESAPPRGQGSSNRSLPSLKTTDLAPVPAPPPPATRDASAIRVETSLVTVPVTVLDRGGQFVPNLTQSDFHVFEDGVEQRIDHFSSTEAVFNVVLLLDTSFSMHLQGTGVQRAAAAFVKELHPQDRVSVISANSEVYVEAEFSTDRSLLETAIYQARNGAGTRLYDAVDLVLSQWLSRVQNRKAIIIFSDGVDTESRLTDAQRSLAQAEESGVLIYCVRFDTANDLTSQMRFNINDQVLSLPARSNVSAVGEEAYRNASQYLSDLAERTGAREFQTKTIGGLNQAFSQIAEDLRQQYEITYYPANTARDGAYRHIRVQVDRPDTAVRARPGYRAAQTPASAK